MCQRHWYGFYQKCRCYSVTDDWNWVTGARSVKPTENVAAELADQGIHCNGDDDERSVVG